MSNANLTNDVWVIIFRFLTDRDDIYTGNEVKTRKFVEAVLWMLRSGAQWRLLPENRGKWNSIFKRFDRWGKKGIWDSMFKHFSNDPDMENIMVDSTVVRAHACSAGAVQKEGEENDQALGRSKGGFSTKIHILVDALGNPLKFILTSGQSADVTQAIPLLSGHQADNALLDKAYDADDVINFLERCSIVPVIPPKSNRKEPRGYDKHLYKERHLVECFIGKLKQFRRIFSRFDKTSINYLHFIYFASALIWLR